MASVAVDISAYPGRFPAFVNSQAEIEVYVRGFGEESLGWEELVRRGGRRSRAVMRMTGRVLEAMRLRRGTARCLQAVMCVSDTGRSSTSNQIPVSHLLVRSGAPAGNTFRPLCRPRFEPCRKGRHRQTSPLLALLQRQLNPAYPPSRLTAKPAIHAVAALLSSLWLSHTIHRSGHLSCLIRCTIDIGLRDRHPV